MAHSKDELSEPKPGSASATPPAAQPPRRIKKTSPQAVETPVEKTEESETIVSSRRWVSVPAWLVSMLVHIAMLLFMAAYHIPEIGNAVSSFIVSASSTDDAESLDDFSIEDAMEMETPKEAVETPPASSPVLQNVVSDIPIDVQIDAVAPTMASVQLSSLSSEMLSTSLSSGQQSMKKGLTSRSKNSKRELLDRYGGNDETEKAVAAALKWLSQHQLPDGSWTFAHGLACGSQCKDNGKATEARNAATGLALMCYLGAGQTHLEGEYKSTVFKGLSFLLRNMKVTDGKMPSWYSKGGGSSTGVMYAHGIASIAMCEAYGMSKDPDLKVAAQASINFIAYAQDPSRGGWDYSPRKSGGGDTSVVGWQLMALKSAAMSGLTIPPGVSKKAEKYLDSVSSSNGSIYGYRTPKGTSASAMTACGLLCKMYMGLPKDNSGLNVASEAIVKKGPDPKNVYYNYYATQVLKQVGGPLWTQWDEKMKKELLSTQEKSGHAAGSWYNKAMSHGDVGGRLYITTMSTMMLEVYYRYMPIYGVQAEDEAFKL
jgi:hypothetical protein